MKTSIATVCLSGGLHEKLEAIAKKNGIKNVPLTIYDGESGPNSYHIAKQADVTVMMWNKMKVQVNHAFANAKISADDQKKVAGDTSKILE